MEKDFDQYAEQTALFDTYLRGEMPHERHADFEARLAAGETPDPDGTSPAVDSLDTSPKNKPGGPVASGGENRPGRYGASKLEQVTVVVPVLRVVVRGGQKTTVAAEANATLTIFLTTEARASGSAHGDLVQVYLPEKQYRGTEPYRLVRLSQEGVQKPGFIPADLTLN